MNGTYLDDCSDEQPFAKSKYTCNDEVFQSTTGGSGFTANKFGLTAESMTFIHTVYLGGSMTDLPSTPHCCDCFNTAGITLFNETIKLGECED